LTTVRRVIFAFLVYCSIAALLLQLLVRVVQARLVKVHGDGGYRLL
jgi:ABC-type nitrate/sulfonate/bicarbonate transport system permease component